MKIAFVGDIYVPDSRWCQPSRYHITEYFDRFDHVVCNLEAPITTDYAPIEKKGPVMAQDKSVITLLERLGVDVVGLANNHIADHGAEGLKNTKHLLSENGFLFGGAGVDEREIYGSVYLRGIDGESGVSLLFVGEDGFGCNSLHRESYGYAWMFSPAFERELGRCVNSGEPVVVVVHGGTEHTRQPLPQWRRMFKGLVDRGVSAVIAHHPHVTQGVEVYRGSPIFYSLGNFYFCKDRTVDGWFDSQIAALEITDGGCLTWSVSHSKFSLGMSGEIQLGNDWGERRTKCLSDILSVESSYEKELKKDLQWLWDKRYKPGLGHSFLFWIDDLKSSPVTLARKLYRGFKNGKLSDPGVFEHYMDIESHRWALAEIMRSKRRGDVV